MVFACMFSILHYLPDLRLQDLAHFQANLLPLAVAGLHRASPSTALDNKDTYLVLDTIP